MERERQSSLEYQHFVRELDATIASGAILHPSSAVLDGLASSELRRLVPLSTRRELGAFFTPHQMADELAAPLRGLAGTATVADTSCGAGDLLLAAIQAMAPAISTERLKAKLVGLDIVNEFAAAASNRVALQASALGVDIDTDIACGDGSIRNNSGITHLLLNPPFATVQADLNCPWAQGSVNGAAFFMARTLESLEPGTQVHAILPEVLRTGSRYEKWRRHIEQTFRVDELSSKGRFDRWTDVDVFFLIGKKMEMTQREGDWVPRSTGVTVGNRFSVSVGPVVDYRSPKLGQWAPYLTAKGFPTWSTINEVARNRRFSGTLHSAPFVVIPRTSRPSEPVRARGAIVTDERNVAVDNHLLVAHPNSNSQRDCDLLLEVLANPETSRWLDEVMRCRHLTVGAVKSIPWSTRD